MKTVSPHTTFRRQLSKKSITFFIPFLGMLLSTTAIAQVLRIMPLGDSITAGEHYGYPAFGERTGYRKPLYEILKTNAWDVNFVGSLNWGYNIKPPFDCDHEGHPGWTASQIASNVYSWLEQNPPDIILAHVGTNGLSADNDKDVKRMLDEIDRYETDKGLEITVLLARIIHRYQKESIATTTAFNDRIEALAVFRVQNQGDRIIVVDMENDAGIDYMTDGADMLGTTYPGVSYDRYHPSDQGNAKMAQLWWKHLKAFLAPHGASDPSPGYGSYQWPATFKGFRWTVPAPGHPDEVVTCDVYIGTEPHALRQMVANEPVDTLSSKVFPILPDTVYYWRVDCTDPNAGNPIVTDGRLWTFHTVDPVPQVDAGQDQLGKAWGRNNRVTLKMNATVTDEGDPNAVLYYLWTVESAPAGVPEVVFNDNTIEDPSVVFAAAGQYILRLSASDDGPAGSPTSKEVGSDTVTVSVSPPPS